MTESHAWSRGERELLNELAASGLSDSEIGALLGRARWSVKGKRAVEGNQVNRCAKWKWTSEEDALLRDWHTTLRDKELSEILERSIGSVRTRRHVLGAVHEVPAGGYPKWTEEEKKIFRQLYPHVPRKHLIRVLDKTLHAVKTKAREMKARKSAAFLASIGRTRPLLSPQWREIDCLTRLLKGKLSEEH